MSGYLTTHVLDLGSGRPAADLEIELFRIDGDSRRRIRSLRTNSDGRTDSPILPEAEFETGTYELVFHAGAYLGETEGSLPFLDLVPIRFTMPEASHYHVPLLLSRYGYSTYRGS